jgi:hypothetical protein
MRVIKWLLSNEANNFGTLLLGVTSIVTFAAGSLYFWRLRKEKRMEKRSNIAEESLLSLDYLIFQLTDWLSKSATWFIYSRHSKANKLQLQEASEEKKSELNRMYESNSYELRNHCESFKKMMEYFFRAKNRTSHLENQSLDEKFKELESILQKFPGTLCSYHQLNDSDDSWPEKGHEKAKSWQFIVTEGPNMVSVTSEAIQAELRKVLLFKK